MVLERAARFVVPASLVASLVSCGEGGPPPEPTIASAAARTKKDVTSLPRYRVRAIGMLPGAVRSIPTAINENGVVVGYAEDGGGSGRRAWKWENGVTTDLGLATGSYATDINNSGQILAYKADVRRGVLIEEGSVTDPLPFLEPLGIGGTESHLTSINSQGMIAGWWFAKPPVPGLPFDGTNKHAFTWQNGTISFLPHLAPEARDTRATSINDSGQIVGWALGYINNDPVNGYEYSPVLWQNGSVTKLPVLSSGNQISGFPNSINNAGQIVGYSDGKPVTWINGALTVLCADPLANSCQGDAVAINNSGQIVGVSSLDESLPFPHSYGLVTWINGTSHSVRSLIDPGDPLVNQLSFQDSAVALNDKGQIVTIANVEDGTAAFLLSPLTMEGVELVNEAKETLAAIPATGNTATDAALASAVAALDSATNPALYVDATHLTDEGAVVFSQTASAVQTLLAIQNPPPEVQAAIAAAVQTFVASAQLLAQTAIADALLLPVASVHEPVLAMAHAGIVSDAVVRVAAFKRRDEQMVRKASAALAEGNAAAAAGKPAKAIQAYGDAWEWAKKAMKH